MNAFGVLVLVGFIGILPDRAGADTDHLARPVLIADALSRQNFNERSHQACLCYRVCEFLSRGVFGRVKRPVDPQLNAKCPRLFDEVIYDNMANCACVRTPEPRPGTSPNH